MYTVHESCKNNNSGAVKIFECEISNYQPCLIERGINHSKESYQKDSNLDEILKNNQNEYFDSLDISDEMSDYSSTFKDKYITNYNSDSNQINKLSTKLKTCLQKNNQKNKCVLTQKKNKICNIGGFKDTYWYRRIRGWEKIIDEKYNSVYSSYERKEMIGTGTYAKVWLLQDKITGQKYAGKLLEPHTYPSDTVDRIERMFQSEIENLIESQCPGVVRLHKIVVGPEGCLLVQDYVDDGTIWRENCCTDEDEAFLHFIQLVQSVLYFQDKGVVHRDLKPTNILRYSNKTIVIGDFGWSEKIDKLHLSPSEWPGTLEINPPEVLTFKGPLTEKIDNYAIGMNLLLFLTGRFICRQKGLDVTEAAPYILKVVELIRHDFSSKILKKNKNHYFMWEMFIGFTDPNPTNRWSIQKALFHPECIQQLIYCFKRKYQVLWHPKILAIIQSNIVIPNILCNNKEIVKHYKCNSKKSNSSSDLSYKYEIDQNPITTSNNKYNIGTYIIKHGYHNSIYEQTLHNQNQRIRNISNCQYNLQGDIQYCSQQIGYQYHISPGILQHYQTETFNEAIMPKLLPCNSPKFQYYQSQIYLNHTPSSIYKVE
ncbi:hypothetical protein cand_018870 [Cryptosporidium andersoni]|uniref:non-specific serine/threonine protein kinase n=1 Tax=Cryptosporidium andersoni TaxID=117008 RepID=A0A1J4M9Z7_9CRYT|nr:hypothetical protein cand_018870 [Cryptosporidium andersoni]